MQVDLLQIGLLFGIVLLSLIIHEVAHGLVAYWLGDDTAKLSQRLTLNPLAHLDPFMSFLLPIILLLSGMPVIGGAKPVPVNKYRLRWNDYGMALVALAGPLSNFILAFVCFFVLSLGWVSNPQIISVFTSAIFINLALMLFNLLPIPPLDGSRIIYSIAPDSVQDMMNEVERRFSTWIVILVVLVAQGFIFKYIEFGSSVIVSFWTSLLT